MDELSGSDTKLAWLWVIEYLASFPQIDPSILYDLIEKAPEELPENLGRSTRERVALRCMEHLFCSDNAVASDGLSAANPENTFDTSKSCEDVLLSVLKETSISDLRMARPDMLKWNTQPFIMHKRASMPKCALEQLKDAILEGSHPYAASVIEASGLMRKDGKSERVPVDGDHDNVVSWRIDANGTNAQIIAPEGSSISLLLENNYGIEKGDSHHQNLLPMKRNGDDLANENGAGNQEDQSGTDDGNLHLNTKRLKCCSSSVDEPREQILRPQCGNELVGESFKRMIGSIEKESSHMERESEVGGLGKCKHLENGHDKFAACKRIGKSPTIDTMNEIQHNQCGNADDANKMPQDTSGDGSCQDILAGKINEAEPRPPSAAPSMRIQQELSADNTTENSDCGNHRKLPNAVSPSGSPREMTIEGSEDSMQHLYVEDTSSDDDDYHFEKVDVAMERSHFLSSQCTLSHASLSDWTELNLCVICSKDAQLLVCNAVGCPLAVHEKCLGCSPKFDENGNFYCPFCAYSYSIKEYIEAKMKAASARKELLAFIRQGPERSCSKENHSLKQNANEVLPDRTFESENLRERDSDHTNKAGHAYQVNGQLKERKANNEPEEPGISHMNVNLMCGEEEPDVTHVISSIPHGEKEREGMNLEYQSVKGHDRQDQIFSDLKHNSSNALCKNKEIVCLNQREAEGVIEKEVLKKQSSDLLEKPVSTVIVAEGRTNNDENEEHEMSNYSLRVRRTENQYVYPSMPRLRRKKVPWTVEEEEMLKEGLQKFSNNSGGNIPWKKILEYGGSVFWSGRIAMDLKDKWRNLCKGSPKCK